MKATEVRPLVDELNSMILQGQILEAFDKFYADNVVMQDNNYPLREGKAVCRQFEEAFVSNLTAFRGAKVGNITVIDGGIAAIEWWFDYSHKEWGDRNYSQLSVQRWENGKIVEEKFYYGS